MPMNLTDIRPGDFVVHLPPWARENGLWNTRFPFRVHRLIANPPAVVLSYPADDAPVKLDVALSPFGKKAYKCVGLDWIQSSTAKEYRAYWTKQLKVANECVGMSDEQKRRRAVEIVGKMVLGLKARAGR